MRGLSGDVILEEAAFFLKDGWQASIRLSSSITRNPDYKLVVISTPRTKSDIFGHLWRMSEGNPLWFRQKLTIYDAVEKGLRVSVEELREGVPTEEIWLQEYLCEFLEEESILLPYELIHACTVEGIEADIRDLRGDVYLGVDIGRRHDLTVVSVLEKIGPHLYLRKQEVLKKLPFSEQLRIIDHMTSYARKVAIDETGIGMQMAEELAKKWGELKVLRVYFTAKVKEELAGRLRTKFEDRTISIPPDRELIEDLHSVKKTLTPSGNIKIEGQTADSHADRFWSLALAVHASSQEEEKVIGPLIFASARPSGGLRYGTDRLG
ncbi:MAG: hypothetical protein Q9N34_01255 [Aquificota bacterium]|nr:hypothetical protein [Aquificota bacterium]